MGHIRRFFYTILCLRRARQQGTLSKIHRSEVLAQVKKLLSAGGASPKDIWAEAGIDIDPQFFIDGLRAIEDDILTLESSTRVHLKILVTLFENLPLEFGFDICR